MSDPITLLLAAVFLISLLGSLYYLLSRLWFITLPVGTFLLLALYSATHAPQ